MFYIYALNKKRENKVSILLLWIAQLLSTSSYMATEKKITMLLFFFVKEKKNYYASLVGVWSLCFVRFLWNVVLKVGVSTTKKNFTCSHLGSKL